MKRANQNIIIQSSIDGTTVGKRKRTVHNITRDDYGNESGIVILNGRTYTVARNGNTWYGKAN